MDNKKVLAISITAVVVLVLALAATSYAMFSANLTGSKENELTTGYVTLNCTEKTFELENTSPMNDTEGIALENNAAECTLTSEMKGTMTIGYDIALDGVDTKTPEDGITEDNVKIQVSKTITEPEQGQLEYLLKTNNTEGIYVSTIKESKGQYDRSIDGYKLDSDTITGNKKIVYKIVAWVSNEQAENTRINDSNIVLDENGKCSNSSYTDKDTCENASEIWGDSKKSTQEGGTFSFKLKIGATQVLENN